MISFYENNQQALIKERLKSIFDSLTASSDNSLWVVLSKAQSKNVRTFLLMTQCETTYLLDDDIEDLQEEGPIAVKILNNDKVIQWFVDYWGNNWFSFFITTETDDVVIQRLSSLCYLQYDEGKTLLFRYFDPITFDAWSEGLIQLEKIHEALGVFTSIIYETKFPHKLALLQLTDKGSNKEHIDLLATDFEFTVSNDKQSTINVSRTTNCWKLDQLEWNALSYVTLRNFIIQLRKRLVVAYGALEHYSLVELTSQIEKKVEQALTFNIDEKYLLANFVELWFRNRTTWGKLESSIENILSNNNLKSQEKIEKLIASIEG